LKNFKAYWKMAMALLHFRHAGKICPINLLVFQTIYKLAEFSTEEFIE
jgi:hypothetical protein